MSIPLLSATPLFDESAVSLMLWIAIRMLTGDAQKFYGLLFGIAFSTLLITQQLTIFVNLIERGASGVFNAPEAEVWVMDPVSRTTEVNFAMPSTALDEVRSVEGVEWAVPHLRAPASVRSSTGDLEGVQIVGVDDATLIGLPERLLVANKSILSQPDTVLIDDVGITNLFESGEDPIGQRLELNDQRAIIRGVADAIPSFTSQVTLYTKYSQALNYVPGTRNRLTFVLVGVKDGESAESVAQAIEDQTGLKAETREEFAQAGIDFIIENTGIPLNFGITVALGFIVGVAIVGLTFSLFIRDNIKQFGALKAIGVTNGKIATMVVSQATMVGSIGYALGVIGTVLFIYGFSGVPTFKGFYIPWQIPFVSLAAVIVILSLTGWISLRSVMKTEPAAVFR
ncbi:MAG: FtsX-like permease family protein [Pseudomonadota bacterium]